MTATVLNVTRGETVIAADSVVWHMDDDRENGRMGKLYPLPLYNAVLCGGNPVAVILDVVHEVYGGGYDSLDGLRRALPGIMAWAYDRQREQRCGCLFVLATAGRAWLYKNDNGFAEMPIPPDLYVDPALDGSTVRPEPFGGDDHIMNLLWRTRHETDRHVGGVVNRIRINSNGMEIASIGDMGAPSAQPPRPPAERHASAVGPKVGRNALCPCGSGRKAKRCCKQ